MDAIEPTEIIATLRESLVVLTEDLKVEFASPRFFETFEVDEQETIGHDLASLGNGQWNIPSLIDVLSRILDEHITVEDYEVEHQFEHIGRKVMRLNARKTVRPGNGSRRILLAIEDITTAADVARQAERNARLSQGIVDTIREPLLVLDGDLKVVSASRSFFDTFGVTPEATIGRRIWELGDGQWSIPELIHLLTTVIPAHSEIEDFEVTHDFPGLGERTILLNARKIFGDCNTTKTLLLAMEDVTEKRRVEGERKAALAQANDLLEELNHRVMNSLTMIASIISVERRTLSDESAALAFDRLYARVMSVASLYKKLSANRSIETVGASDYLGAIVKEARASINREDLKLNIGCDIDDVALTTRTAVPLGLVVNEVVTNSMKYAFQGRDAGKLDIVFRASQTAFDLTIRDDGVGIDENARVNSGMGQRLVAAFTQQLDGVSHVKADQKGTRFILTMPRLLDEAQKTGAAHLT
ncbi:sensor histidine kinase [Thalassococcus sp. S3]|uniref:sensor histidine kinase n=1 Tax=Thalassococcus sp. S3 TaxID=2017482 RepID=UPI0010243C25|nr:histidine kinase dimerization/phosphoacceptor domain -containing protein [Thalassococcus sp. S3]QBF29882.1 hypothetical protein CFI11_01435 [Thalassococcus sp. S3]